MLKNILYFFYTSITFMCIAGIMMIYVFNYEASFSLLIKWFIAGAIWTLVLERKKYFSDQI